MSTGILHQRIRGLWKINFAPKQALQKQIQRRLPDNFVITLWMFYMVLYGTMTLPKVSYFEQPRQKYKTNVFACLKNRCPDQSYIVRSRPFYCFFIVFSYKARSCFSMTVFWEEDCIECWQVHST